MRHTRQRCNGTVLLLAGPLAASLVHFGRVDSVDYRSTAARAALTN